MNIIFRPVIDIIWLIMIVLIGSWVISYAGTIYFGALSKFFANSRLYQQHLKTIEGLHILGVFWRC